MTGGLIQLVSSGKQDGYLTFNPQITFFKKIYRRHTIFGIEFLETAPDQQPEYNNRVTFILNNISDLISRCYVEITIPTLSFTESATVTNLKQNQLQNLQNQINKWSTLYTNLKNYCSIEILLYQNVTQLLESINITLNLLKQNVIKFNSKYKATKNSLQNLIVDNVFSQINLTGYILQLNLMIVSNDYTPYNTAIEININDLTKNINEYYNNMITNLKYYYSNYIYYTKQYNNLNNKNVPFAWNKNLAHIFFTDFEVEIGGQSIEKYSLEQSLIYQKHHLPAEQTANYDVMIGNTGNLSTFDNSTKVGQTLLIPLNFWFCKDIGCALPTVALANSNVSLNLKINTLKNLLYFEDLEQEYYNFLVVTVPKDITTQVTLNYSSLSLDINTQLITYHCTNITYGLLEINYPSLASVDGNDDLTEILNLYGKTVNNQRIMQLNEWLNFRRNYKKDQNVINPGANNNFIQYYSSVSKPQISLITESVYLDDIERNKFASVKLEYVVEIFQENIYDIENQGLVSGEFSIDRPVKELSWITQPKLFVNGFTEYGKTYITDFQFNQFLKNTYYNSLSITLNQQDIIKPIYDYNFFNHLQSYQYYNNSLPDGVYAYNFGLYPEENQPSGTANFTMFKGKLFNFVLNKNFLIEYFNTTFNPNQFGLTLTFMARSYNFLIVEKGMGRMVFANN
jgi:hypothetical protein